MKLELSIYFFIWISANIYSLYRLFEAQSDILNSNPHVVNTLADLQKGWGFIGRHKDVSDVDWVTWKYFVHISWRYLLIHFVISEYLRNKFPSILKHWYIISSVTFVTLTMGYRQMIIILTQPVIYIIILYGGGKKLSIWLVSILLLLSYNTLKYMYYFWSFLDYKNIQVEGVYLILFSIAWIELRCISYSLDFVERKDGKLLKQEDIIDIFSYALYLPLLFTGPIVLYKEFENSFVTRRDNLKTRIKRFIYDMMAFQLYSLILDLVLHYIYFFAMQKNMELIRKLPEMALCGGALFMGLKFHMKYVITYGTTGSFARLDHMEPPPTPRCIARIHVYSQMWRYFDVGLYRFLVKYIYKPGYSMLSQCCNLPNITYKLIASLATFVFIFVWHGTVWHIFVWSLLNYMGITIEHMAKYISRTESYTQFRNNILRSKAVEARFMGILCTPLLGMSAISNSYLFAGNDIGNFFFVCVSHASLLSTILLGGFLYCFCRVSMALESVPSRGVSKKVEGKE
ncbi:protein-cysteine N-palmitoyltransferase Rasp-like [Bicyclus anynana]|uniref:Protein-cysteine N-palmitoyltransferase Rasp-like n=1 Tax=Bicyclus anynana TaxID=110368 RepID=A0ABM3LF37_BICAN|nr:protein-cysteine N-palmitoyltransferase Rasp-like [Bicyclus anynana]